MGLTSFLGRVLFASLFILPALQTYYEFGELEGPGKKEWAPKLAFLQKILPSHWVPFIKTLITLTSIHTPWLGGVGFLLCPYPPFAYAAQLMLYLLYSTPILYDFYNYKPDEPEFFYNLHEFLQCVALFGGLLYYLDLVEIHNRVQRSNLQFKREQLKKRISKAAMTASRKKSNKKRISKAAMTASRKKSNDQSKDSLEKEENPQSKDFLEKEENPQSKDSLEKEENPQSKDSLEKEE